VLAAHRLATLLAAAALITAPATAFAQGAGDQQYQDPFGGQQSGSGTQTTPNVQQTPPPLAPTVSTPSGSAGTPASPGTSSAQPGSLPNTGADARLLAAFGLGLLIAGIGLRLRTADERF
jgi:LPXTG-motif cell wall-anchored protein